MPQDNSIAIWKSPYVDRRGQSPLTRFIPMDECIGVEIVEVSIPRDVLEFAGACHRTTANSKMEAIDQDLLIDALGRGKTLWQCGEIVMVSLKLTGVSRVFTHQLVRARIGVSFSQQCTGDVDMRHADVTVPNCLMNGDDRTLYEEYCGQALKAKALYVHMLDRGKSIQEARYCLPAGLTGHIHLRICLSALAELYKKRSCTMTQTWEMIEFTDRLKREINLKAPWARPLFKSCRGSQGSENCWWHGTKRTPFANTHLWKPDLDHDRVDTPYNIASFVHQKTHSEVSNGPAGIVSYFDGVSQINEPQWRDRAGRVGLIV